MTNSNNETKAARQVIQHYIDETYHADAEKLRECFHEKALMSGYLGDQMMISGPESFFEEISKNPSMSKAGAPYNDEITSIEVTGDILLKLVKLKSPAKLPELH